MGQTSSRVYSPGGERVAVTEFVTTRAADPIALRQIEREVAVYVRDNRFAHLIVDCGHIKEYSSPFLTILMHIKKQCDDKGVTLRVCGMNKTLAKAFKACRLDEVIAWYDTLDSALGL